MTTQRLFLRTPLHGISLEERENFDWDTAFIEEDRSENYGEQREREPLALLVTDSMFTSTQCAITKIGQSVCDPLKPEIEKSMKNTSATHSDSDRAKLAEALEKVT